MSESSGRWVSSPASSQVPSSVRKLSRQLCEESANPELNATAVWFLRRHGYESDIADVVIPKSIGYRTSEGHTMVRLPGGVDAMVGASALDRSQLANERRHKISVPTRLYLSRDELSAQQLDRFRESVNSRPLRADRRDRQQTAMRIGFFTAAAYCNWLSEQEGIPQDEWIYLPNEQGEIGPGMQIVDDPLDRSGYQIPTPDLWEYACRGGTSTPRYYGFGTEISNSYIRWADTGSRRPKRLTARIPNHFGLFDMLGNGAEWSVGLVDRRRNAPRRPGSGDFRPNRPRPGNRSGRPSLAFGGGPLLMSAAGQTIRENNQFVVLGGSFDSQAQKIRCSDRSVISPPITNKPLTLRLMRIVPAR